MLIGPEQSGGVPKVESAPADLTFKLLVAGGIAGLLHMIGVVGFGRGFEMVAVARNLADHGSFADPFDAASTGLTAANPPLYPFILACWFRILGNPSLVTYAAVIGNMAANALTAILLPRLSKALFDDVLPGIFAAIACLAAMQLMPAWDTSYTVAGLILFCLLSVSPGGHGRYSAVHGGLAGIGAGLLVLLNPSSMMVTLPWAIWMAIRRKAAVWCLALLSTLCLVVSVWLLRNDLQLGAPVLRTNFGMSVYASNNDCASASLIEDERFGCYEAHHPNTSREEAQLVRTLGEVAYDRQRTADAFHWMTSHPGRFSLLTLRRIREFWFPSLGGNSWSTVAIWILTAFSIPGFVLMIRRRAPGTFFVLTVVIMYPLMYYIVVSDSRYRYPILWISALAAGYGASAMKARVQARLPTLVM